jgi:hypothetical protein
MFDARRKSQMRVNVLRFRESVPLHRGHEAAPGPMAAAFGNRQRLFELLKRSGSARACCALRWEDSTPRCCDFGAKCARSVAPGTRTVHLRLSGSNDRGAVFGHFIYIVPGIQ